MTGTQRTARGTADDDTENEEMDLDSLAQGKDSLAQGKRPHLMPLLPIFLGVFICGLNFIVALRLWRSTYQSQLAVLTRMNLPTNVCLALILTSFGIGLLLIAYAVVLQHTLRNGQLIQLSPGSAANHTQLNTPMYLKWILFPVLLALPAPALTVWAAQVIEPISPKPCIEIYQEAVNISKDDASFKMPWTDRDQLRCNINSVIRQ